jgi:hypothetical protein
MKMLRLGKKPTVLKAGQLEDRRGNEGKSDEQ